MRFGLQAEAPQKAGEGGDPELSDTERRVADWITQQNSEEHVTLCELLYVLHLQPYPPHAHIHRFSYAPMGTTLDLLPISIDPFRIFQFDAHVIVLQQSSHC